MKRIIGIILALASVVLLVGSYAAVSSAQNVKTGETATVAAGETVDGMFFGAGNAVVIDGTVKGDVFCAGQTVTLRGTVEGDVFCVGQTVQIDGVVDGSVHVAGQSVAIGGQVMSDVAIASQTALFASNSMVGRDLLGVSQIVKLDGVVQRDVLASVSELSISGAVGRNVAGDMGSVIVGDSGKINGNLTYTGTTDPVVQSGGQIAGSVDRTMPAPREEQPSQISYAPIAFTAANVFYSLFALIAFSVVLVALLPRMFHEAATQAIRRPGYVVLAGFVAVITIPVVIIFLLATIVGIPLALLFVLIWCVMIMLSGPFAAYFIGRLVLKKSSVTMPVLVMLVGSAILVATYFIPVVGFITMLSAYVFGIGMIVFEAGRRLPRPSQKIV